MQRTPHLLERWENTPPESFSALAPHDRPADVVRTLAAATFLSQLWTCLSVPSQTVKPDSSPAALRRPNPAWRRLSAVKKTEAPADTAPRRYPFQVRLLSDIYSHSKAIRLWPLTPPDCDLFFWLWCFPPDSPPTRMTQASSVFFGNQDCSRESSSHKPLTSTPRNGKTLPLGELVPFLFENACHCELALLAPFPLHLH